MGVKIVELAGGLALLVVEAMIIVGLLELGCRVFFWVKEKE